MNLESAFSPSRKRDAVRTAFQGRGFSLIEVALAMGLVSFGLIGVLGLIPVALNTSRQASNDTAMAAMTEFVSNTLGSQRFASDKTNATAFFAFNQDGRVLTNSIRPLSLPDAFFTCTVTQVPCATSTNVLYYRLRFLWPMPAVNANVSTNLTSISVVNMD